jgi:hypothetical protein
MISGFFLPNVGGVESHVYMFNANLIGRGRKVSLDEYRVLCKSDEEDSARHRHHP